MELVQLLTDFDRDVRRVLVVEDDLELSSVLERVLKSIDSNIDVDWATSTESAVEILKSDLRESSVPPYDLVVVDIFLEGDSTGIEFWAECQELFPDIPILVTSALSLNEFFAMIGNQEISPPFLQKPFSAKECRQMFQTMLKYGSKTRKSRYPLPSYLT